jgi:tetratricopeptide (TPR) repeat protein
MSVKRASGGERKGSQALELFEKAVKAMGKKDHERALELFDSLISAHAEERDLVERARAYRVACERAAEKRPAFRPKTFEELLHYGVFLHNRGEYQEALRHLGQAVEMHPKNEHAQYCLAASAARAGEAEAALKALRSAIAASAANRTQARGDSDFDPLREHEEFVALVYPQAS